MTQAINYTLIWILYIIPTTIDGHFPHIFFSASPLDPPYQLYCFILNKLLGLPGKALMLSMKMSNALSLTLFPFSEQSR